ncbi:TPA: hypothetical protein QIB60_000507 [Enterobacter cloacae subsp. dissolvens]|nr:hypothetical protein [Enterobacter cloacae subsp. dissolvens]
MEKISFEIYASDATIKPDDYNRLRVEVDGVEISDLLEAIEDNGSLIDSMGGEAIAEHFSTEGRLFEFLDNFDSGELADYLETKGWKIQEGE